jgi:hypothetical protein
MFNWILFALVVVLQGIDAYSTWLILSKPGGKELNKIMSFLMEKIGILPALLLTKGVFCAVLSWVVYFYQTTWMIYLLIAIILGYSWVIWHNAKEV